MKIIEAFRRQTEATGRKPLSATGKVKPEEMTECDRHHLKNKQPQARSGMQGQSGHDAH